MCSKRAEASQRESQPVAAGAAELLAINATAHTGFVALQGGVLRVAHPELKEITGYPFKKHLG